MPDRKKRWSDPQGLKKRSPSRKYTLQTVVSYRVFCKEQHARLVSQYPFLTKHQIACKVRQLWTNLENDKKKAYTKKVLHATPDKKRNKTKKDEKSPLNVSPKKQLVSNWDVYKEDSKNAHEDDFGFAQLLSPAGKRTSTSPDWLKERVSCLKKSTGKNYSGNEYLLDSNKIPCILQNTPSNPQGIMKRYRHQSDGLNVSKGRVSFSTNDEAAVIDSSHAFEEDESEDLPNDSDNEEDCKLIRREMTEDYNFDNIEGHNLCVEGERDGENTNTRSKKIQKSCKKADKYCEKENIMGSHEFSNIHKKSVFEKVHDLNEVVEMVRYNRKSQTLQNCSKEKVKELSKSVENMRSRKRTQQNNTLTRNVEELREMVEMVRSRKHSLKVEAKSDTMPTKNLGVVETPVNLPELPELDNYTTPLMDDGSYNYAVDGVEKAPRKRKSLPMGSRNLRSLNTPETDAQQAINENLPQPVTQRKARTSLLGSDGVTFINEKGDATVSSEPMKQMVQIQHNIRRTPNNNTCRYKLRQRNTPLANGTDPLSNSQPQKAKSEKSVDLKKDKLSSSESNYETTLRKHQKQKETPPITGDNLRSKVNKQKKIENLVSKQGDVVDSCIRQKSRSESKASGISGKPWTYQMSDIMNENCAVTLDIKGDAESCLPTMILDEDLEVWDKPTESLPAGNKALVKVLQNMRNVVSASPVYSECGASSPRLLSPAVSGISELSGFSWDSTENKPQADQGGWNAPSIMDITEKPVCEESIHTDTGRHTRSRTSTLCDMFDVPRKEKMKENLGKRMVSSAAEETTSNFTELFQEADIFLKRELLKPRDYKVDLDSKLGRSQVITKTHHLHNKEELREEEEKQKAYRKEKRKERKRRADNDLSLDQVLDPDMAAVMGFSGFGGAKKQT
ncbi:hypothetical protein ScPMuIL_011466 [Solemya velum]